MTKQATSIKEATSNRLMYNNTYIYIYYYIIYFVLYYIIYSTEGGVKSTKVGLSQMNLVIYCSFD